VARPVVGARIGAAASLTNPWVSTAGQVPHDHGGLLNRASYRRAGQLSRPYAGLIHGWRNDRLALAPQGKPTEGSPPGCEEPSSGQLVVHRPARPGIIIELDLRPPGGLP